jgi:four helix bundle protein
MHNIKEMKIWQKAVDLTLEVYQLTKDFPTEEKFGLVSQMRKAAVSIASNIAEGAGRNSDNEFVQFLGIANGSSFELYTQSYISSRLEFLKGKDFDSIESQLIELQKMIHAFKNRLKSNI